MKIVAEVIGVSHSNLHDRLRQSAEPRRRYHKVQDAAVVRLITALIATRPTYGYRRITALPNRQLRSEEATPINHKRVYRIMQAHGLLLARRYTPRPDLAHDGKFVTLLSNLRRVGLRREITKVTKPFDRPTDKRGRFGVSGTSRHGFMEHSDDMFVDIPQGIAWIVPEFVVPRHLLGVEAGCKPIGCQRVAGRVRAHLPLPRRLALPSAIRC